VLASVGARKYRHFMNPPRHKTFDYKALPRQKSSLYMSRPALDRVSHRDFWMGREVRDLPTGGA
jgi:hypothetical protein